MENKFHYFKYLDIFAEDAGFVNEGKRNFRSYFGAILSFLMIIAIIIVAFMFGQEVYKRETPSVSSSTEFLKNSQINMTKFPIIFQFSDGSGDKIDNKNDQYYTTKIVKMNFTESGQRIFVGKVPNARLVRCEDKHLTQFKDVLDNITYASFIENPSYCVECPDTEYFQNRYKTNNSTFILFSFTMCSGNSCASNAKLIHTEAYVQMYYINYYIDNLDYNNPVKKYVGNLNQQITDTLLKRVFMNVINNKYISDNGWLIENKQEINYYSLESAQIEINNISLKSPDNVYWITLESNYLRTKNVRNYMKVQDLFAKVGGIVNAFIIIIQIFFCHYFRYNMIMTLRKFLNPSDVKLDCFNSKNLSSKILFVKNNLQLQGDQRYETNTCKNLVEQTSANKINLTSKEDNLLKNTTIKKDKNSNNKNTTENLNKEDTNSNFINNYVTNQEMLNVRERNNLKKLVVNNYNKNKQPIVKNLEKTNEKEIILEDFESKVTNSNYLDVQLKNKLIANNSFVFKNYESIKFDDLSYFDFLYSIVCCNKHKISTYYDIRDEINQLWDIYSFSAYLHTGYRKLDS